MTISPWLLHSRRGSPSLSRQVKGGNVTSFSAGYCAGASAGGVSAGVHPQGLWIVMKHPQGPSARTREGAHHGEEADVTAYLDAADADLDDGAAAVGVEERHALVRRGRHEGALDPAAPRWVAVRHPELGRQ